MRTLKNNPLLLLIIVATLVTGCRGWKSEKPPVHPNINFDFQPKIKAQREPLPIPANTTPYNITKKKLSLSQYKIDEDFMKNGQKNFNIYCATCHTQTGNGTQSIISKKGWVVSNLLEDVTINKSDNELHHIIRNGIRTMPGYGKKLSDKETWQIVLYVRALQKIDNATLKEKNQVRKTLK